MRIFWLIILLIPAIAFGENATYICNYNSYSDIEGNKKVSEKFELVFVVDLNTSKSYLIGNNGTKEVKVFAFDDKVNFLEVTATGNFMVTTIDAELSSVHSRNTVIAGKLVPSQYYGECVAK